MEKIFAPWRAQYILSNSDDKEKIDGCIFCEFPKRDEDEKRMIIERGKYCFVIMNAYPYKSGTSDGRALPSTPRTSPR